MTADVRAPETEPSWTLTLDDAFINTLDVCFLDDFEDDLSVTHAWVVQWNETTRAALVVRGWYGPKSDLAACRRALRPIMERLTAWRREHGEPLHPGPVRL